MEICHFFYMWFFSHDSFFSRFFPHDSFLFAHDSFHTTFFHEWFFSHDSFYVIIFIWFVSLHMQFFSHNSFFSRMIIFTWLISLPHVNLFTINYFHIWFFHKINFFSRLFLFIWFISSRDSFFRVNLFQVIFSHDSFHFTWSHITHISPSEMGVIWLYWEYFYLKVMGAVSLRWELNSESAQYDICNFHTAATRPSVTQNLNPWTSLLSRTESWLWEQQKKWICRRGGIPRLHTGPSWWTAFVRGGEQQEH